MAGPESRFAVLIFTDIVGSMELKSRHGVSAFTEALRIHNQHFERVAHRCQGIRIVQNAGDSYLALAESVTEAVTLALLFQDAMRDGPWQDFRLASRVGIHAGEISTLAVEGGSGVVAPAADLAARVMGLAVGGQILLTRFPFDEARHYLREHPAVEGKTFPPLCWRSHGPYLIKGRDEPLEIFEVGVEGLSPLAPPPDGEKARRWIDGAGTATAGQDGTAKARPASRSREFWFGILTLTLALLLKVSAEKTAVGNRFELWLSTCMQWALNAPPPAGAGGVLIVDISGVRPRPTETPLAAGETEPRLATPRDRLDKIVATIAAQHPRVIGVDIDFSAWEDGQPVTPQDSAFFEKVAKTSLETGIPIYLGVSRQRWEGAEEWLGAPKFRSLAAGIEVPVEPDTSYYYVRWLRGAADESVLPNFSVALAGRAGELDADAEPAGGNWAIRTAQLRSAAARDANESPGVMSWARIDYSQLATLESDYLHVAEDDSNLEDPQKFARRMVLIGDVSKPDPLDRFAIGDLHPPFLAGIYLQACAALTERARPIAELTGLGRIAVHFIVAMLLLGAITSIRHFPMRTQGQRLFSVVRSDWVLVPLAIVASWLVAITLMRLSRIIWTDCLAITVGLLVYARWAHRGARPLHDRTR